MGRGPGGWALEGLDRFQSFLLLAAVQGGPGHSALCVRDQTGGDWPRGGVAPWPHSEHAPVLSVPPFRRDALQKSDGPLRSVNAMKLRRALNGVKNPPVLKIQGQ